MVWNYANIATNLVQNILSKNNEDSKNKLTMKNENCINSNPEVRKRHSQTTAKKNRQQQTISNDEDLSIGFICSLLRLHGAR